MNPTVAELIEALSKWRPDARINPAFGPDGEVDLYVSTPGFDDELVATLREGAV